MHAVSYKSRRGEIETYFDRTAVEAWSKLTSDAPVGRIRATVRAGRDAMRQTLMSWLPGDLRGRRVLDAGCGTAALAIEAAGRGADVVAIDLSANLIGLARQRMPSNFLHGSVDLRVGDMLDPELGAFDHAVAMDSLIHYGADDIVRALVTLAPRVERSILFTVAPRTPLLASMHAVGRLFPRGDRAPSIVPVAEDKMRRLIGAEPNLADWVLQRSHRINSGFYMSLAMELVRK